MVLGQQSSSSRGIVISFWTFLLLISFIRLYTCRPCRAVVQGTFTCRMEASQPNFGGASHCSAKGRLIPKISISFSGLLQDVGLCSSGFSSAPLLFLLLVNLAFSPMVVFQSESPSLPCVSLLLSCLKYIHIFQCGCKFDLCAVSSPVYASYFHTSTAHEAQRC